MTSQQSCVENEFTENKTLNPLLPPPILVPAGGEPEREGAMRGVGWGRDALSSLPLARTGLFFLFSKVLGFTL